MKRFVVSISILSAGLLILTQSFAANPNKEPETEGAGVRKVVVEKPGRHRELPKYIDVDIKFLADSNAVRTKLKGIEGLEDALEKLRKRANDEVREWTRGISRRVEEETIDDRLDLIRDVQRQAVAELVFIREMAVKEGAVKTTAAIEGLLLDRLDRGDGIYERLKEAERMMRERGREERRKRREERRTRDGSSRTDRDREREREYREEMVKKRRLPRRGRTEDSNSVAQ
ncbi:MAG: hypothetical protein ACYSUC_07170 [Planctomycetota bacterium]